jgi:hypothetical protein
VSSARTVGLLRTARTGRGRFAQALGAVACALAVALALPSAVAVAHKGNPNFRSDFRAVAPAIPGIQVQVLNNDDRLLLINRSGNDIVVQGYDDEPYLRILANGTVQENRRSPARYLNEDRFARVDVPPDADSKASPEWQSVDKTGRYEWHDHRIHWMSKSLPPKVKDKDVRTRIFDWRVPIRVGPRRAALTGTLYWQPADSTAPVGAFVGLGVFALLAGALVLAVRSRRRRSDVRREGQAW